MSYKRFTGTATQYRLLHYWVESILGKPIFCNICATKNAKTYEWSNISGLYKKEVSDWQRLCRSCHRLLDYNNKCKKRGHDLTEDNIYIRPSNGARQCLTCKRISRKEQYQRYRKERLAEDSTKD